MDWMQWQMGLLVFGSALITALLAQWALARGAPKRRVEWGPLETEEERTVFLFEDDDLVDATPEAHAMLRAGPEHLHGWPRLHALLERQFPGVGDAIAGLADCHVVSVPAKDNDAEVLAEWRGGLVRVVIAEPETTRQTEQLDGIGLRALGDELATLRGAVDQAPILVWREDEAGVVEWANAPYFDLARKLGNEEEQLAWPLPKLFPLQLASGMEAAERRMSLKLPEAETPLWFDIHVEPLDESTLIHALPADRLVKTEANLREFLQTLTKTFAHLPTGLAVFDRGRRLALFNPALTDLSALQPQFLSARPTLYEFLDKLREKQRMPEPKDYKSWRRQISDMEAAAATGTHQETWSLPTGHTYRVTGRPHPEGAVAFLFEDISSEIAATRRFRAELELGQSILDSMNAAIAVFSAAGTLVQTNNAYGQLWNTECDRSLTEITLLDTLRLWSSRCAPSALWDELRDHAIQAHQQKRWTGQFALLSGARVMCEFMPLQGNACRVSFDVEMRAALPAPDMILQGTATVTAAE